MANVQRTQRKFYALRPGLQFVSNRGDKRSRFLAIRFIPCGIQFLITRSLNKNQARVGFAKSGHGPGSGHLVLQRRDRFNWNRILFGIARAFLEKVTLVDLRGHGASSRSFEIVRGAVDLRAG